MADPGYCPAGQTDQRVGSMGKLSGAVAALALTLVVTSCSSSGESDDAPAPDSAPGAAATITADELVDELATAGIATYAAAGDDTPEVEPATTAPVQVTRWQAENMTRQLNAGGGYVGRELDALVGGDVPISVVLAGYVSAAQTPGGELARELMGDRDWERVALDTVYPDTVLALFAADLAASETGAEPGSEPEALRAPAAPGVMTVQPAAAYAGVYSDISNFLSSTLDSIVEGLKIDAQGGVGGVLASIWNTVVDIAAAAAELALSALTAPVVAAIKGAVTVLAVLSTASSVLDPWNVKVTADTELTSFGIDPAPGKDVTVTAHVQSALDWKWPDDLVDCAGAAGITLPDPGNPAGSPVQWTVVTPELVTQGDHDDVLDKQGEARLHLTTRTESKEDADTGDLIVSPLAVKVHVERQGVEQLKTMLETLVLGAVPEIAAPIVAKLIGPLTGAAADKLAALVDVNGALVPVDVQHHGPAKPTPTPAAESPSDCAVVEGVTEIPDGTFEGPVELDVTGKAGKGVSVDSSGDGEMTVVVEDGKVTGASWSLTWHSSGGGSEGGATVHVELDGTIAGTMAGTAAEPVAKGHWSIHGSAEVTAMGVHQKVPLDEAGSDASTLTVESTTCDDVTATFIPSFNAKTQGVAVISGLARWSGTRVG